MDCLNRCTELVVSLYATNTDNPQATPFIVSLFDTSNQQIDYVCADFAKSTYYGLFDSARPHALSIPLYPNLTTPVAKIIDSWYMFNFSEIANNGKTQAHGNKWYYHTGSTAFDWEHVKKVQIWTSRLITGGMGTWALEVDGFAIRWRLPNCARLHRHQPCRLKSSHI